MAGRRYCERPIADKIVGHAPESDTCDLETRETIQFKLRSSLKTVPDPAKMTPLDVLMGLTVPMVWGMGIVFAKAAIGHFPPILLMAFRFLVAALVLVWFVRPPAGNHARLFFIAIIAAAIQYSFTFTGLKDLSAGVAALVVQLEVPFLVVLGALLLGEKPGPRKWAGIALAFVGVALIAGELRLAGEWRAMLLVVLGALTWALGQVLIRRLNAISGLTITAWIAVYATPQLFVMSLLFEQGQREAIVNAGPTVWAAVLYLGLVMTALGYWLWNSLLRRHEVGTVAPFLLFIPVFSIVGGAIFLGETLAARELLGGAVIIAGVALITIRRRRRLVLPA